MRRFLVLILALLAASPPVYAQAPSVDVLLSRLGEDTPAGYELTARFEGRLALTGRGLNLRGTVAGSFREWRAAGAPKRRQVKVEKVELPLLLRSFDGYVRRTIEERIEGSADATRDLQGYDFFILEERPNRRYVLVGLRRDLVDEAIDRYGKGSDKRDVAVRRSIARWLFTASTMRAFIVRHGVPYAVQLLVDESGQLHHAVAFLEWGQVETRISWTTVGNTPVWREIVTDATSTVPKIGRVDGLLVVAFSDHCVNCRR